jgi:hypothetical protein
MLIFIALPITIVLTSVSIEPVSAFLFKQKRDHTLVALTAIFVLISSHNSFLRRKGYAEDNSDLYRESAVLAIQIQQKCGLPSVTMAKTQAIGSYCFQRLAPDFNSAFISRSTEIETLEELEKAAPAGQLVLYALTDLKPGRLNEVLGSTYEIIEHRFVPTSHIFVLRKK